MSGIIWFRWKKCLLSSHCKWRDSIMIIRAPCCSEDEIYAETLSAFVMTLPVEAMHCHCWLVLLSDVDMLLVLFYPHCNGNLDCAVETWPHSHIIIQKQRILLYIVGRRPTHWRSAFQNAADEFEDCVNIQQSDYHSWFFSCLDKPLWWMQCTTGKKTDLSDATFTKVGCLVVKKATTVTVLPYVCMTCNVRRVTDKQTDHCLFTSCLI